MCERERKHTERNVLNTTKWIWFQVLLNSAAMVCVNFYFIFQFSNTFRHIQNKFMAQIFKFPDFCSVLKIRHFFSTRLFSMCNNVWKEIGKCYKSLNGQNFLVEFNRNWIPAVSLLFSSIYLSVLRQCYFMLPLV